MTTRNSGFDFDAFEDAMMAIPHYQRKADALEGFDRVRNTRPSFGNRTTRKGRAEMLYGRRSDTASAAAEYAAYMASQGR